MSTTPILQFGTSRFLQAHVDLFVSEALERDEAVGPITVVQTSGDPARAHRLKALASPKGFEIRIKGLQGGALVEESKQVRSITRTLALPTDLTAVASIISEEAKIILSNTADAGFKSQPEDRTPDFSNRMSYPGKLTWFLHQRYKQGGAPLQIMPTELVPKNGATLRDLVFGIAGVYPEAFRTWLRSDVLWVNSLVDRIVSEPLEPAGAVAEPYALWAIENQPGLMLPCVHPDVQLVDALEQVETLKLFILNLGHTYLVSRWLAQPDPKVQFVRELMTEPDSLADLADLYEREVIPGFAAHGLQDAADRYAATTIDRFKNPFLDHKLADIAQNHSEKVERRIAAFLRWAKSADRALNMPRLEALASADVQQGAA